MRRGLAPSRQAAQAAVRDGRVRVAGAPAAKPGRLVSPAEPVVVAGPPRRFVSRGGDKLLAALERFGLTVSGRRALDAGSSTGGFTDCLLQHGADAVVALDVGTNQLHEHLRTDPRVQVHEQTNLRAVRAGDLGPPFALVVADLSFISLVTVADELLAQCAPGADLVVLVKPQFEAGRVEVSRGRGVITEPRLWAAALDRVACALCERGATIIGAMASPLRGASGNVEFLLHARAPAPGTHGAAPHGDLLDAAVREVATSVGEGAERG